MNNHDLCRTSQTVRRSGAVRPITIAVVVLLVVGLGWIGRKVLSGGGISTSSDTVVTPNAVGSTFEKAAADLRDRHLAVASMEVPYAGTNAVGTVVAQSISPGTALPAGTQITLTTVGNFVVVPSVTGTAREKASDLLHVAHLTAQAGAERESDTTPPGSVVDQDPKPNVHAAIGSVVHLTIAVPPKLPDLVITDVTPNPAAARSLSTCTFTVTIQNRGSAPVPSNASDWLKCPPQFSDGVKFQGPLGVNETRQVQVAGKAPSGPGTKATFRFTVNQFQGIRESNYANNESQPVVLNATP